MSPESPKLLWDARSAATWIRGHATGLSFSDYVADHTLRLAVERQFITLGEALNQLSRRVPDIAQRIPDIEQIIGFRNVLVHGYAEIDDELVWTIAASKLPDLIEVLDALLGE